MPWIAKQIFDDGPILSLPYKRPMTKKGFYPKYKYIYGESNDWVICPHHQTLYYATTSWEGYWIYKSIPFNCERCPDGKRHHCIGSKAFEKTATQHIWDDCPERAMDVRNSYLGKTSYSLRSQTTPQIFTDAKEKHAMRYTLCLGLKAVTS